jgi:5-methylcytosine-specific restriction endonuclease McrBC regulatory subunit McrC
VNRINIFEGEAFSLDRALTSRLRIACTRLQNQLKASFSILTEGNGLFKINGLVGTIDIGANTLVEISPKTQPEDDWIHSVLDLLIGSDRVDAAGQRAAGLSPNRRSLLEVLASIYAARLERAIRRDGPILLMRRQCSTGTLLKGKLDVTKWTKSALWQPHRFPIAFNALSVDHDFSRALAKAAQLLASLSRSNTTRGRLRSSARALRPGYPEFVLALDQATLRPLPSQWGIYRPAWSIAVAILSQRSLLRRRGQHQGVSIVIEAWPLLERLLERSLNAAARIGRNAGRRSLEAPTRRQFRILTNPTGSATGIKLVEPDGRLTEAERTIATFEAKYKVCTLAANCPDRRSLRFSPRGTCLP